jgi:hypothetical protein
VSNQPLRAPVSDLTAPRNRKGMKHVTEVIVLIVFGVIPVLLFMAGIGMYNSLVNRGVETENA